MPVSPPLPGSHSCSSQIFSCPFTSPLGSTWNTLFLWSAGGVPCPSQDSAMMFSEKIPEFSRKTSHPWSGSQGVGHREWAGGCDIKMPMAAVAGGDFSCVASRDDDTAQSSGLDGPGLQGTQLPHPLAPRDPVQTWRRKHSPPWRWLDSPGHSDHAQGRWSHSCGRRPGPEEHVLTCPFFMIGADVDAGAPHLLPVRKRVAPFQSCSWNSQHSRWHLHKAQVKDTRCPDWRHLG